MIADGVAVGREDERHLVVPGVGDLLHAAVAGVEADLADVDRQHPTRMGAHDLGVHLRVALPGVADEDERQLRVQGEDLLDPAVLGGAALATAEEVAQQQRPEREVPVLEERAQEGVQVPRTGGDVEERAGIGPDAREVAIELGGARERRARQRGAGEGSDAP